MTGSVETNFVEVAEVFLYFRMNQIEYGVRHNECLRVKRKCKFWATEECSHLTTLATRQHLRRKTLCVRWLKKLKSLGVQASLV
ncbi:hypothetical protein P7K49_024877 [Saguinus oedipus]|uniref:Uncharacterized protein n=1 Tax=Saguinus oedipus TaxID=9490 RepID=A0ABQ9UGZ8_SAGOE|nr:hypothetical protein P7K49_024877 [Saguinus oedipus]